ncbi:MAG: hypothetical protein ACE5H4_03400 [Candidatus Thorarchaeota archaeon]
MRSRYILLDWSGVRRIQFRVVLGSALLFITYSIILLLYCSVAQWILLAFLLVSTQIGVGLVFTRYYQTVGMLAKEKLTFLDSSELAGEWESVEEEVSIEEMPRIFQELDERLGGLEPQVDDILDLAWFFIIVWAAVSTALVVLFGSSPILCLSPSPILAMICVACYYNGYQSGKGEISADHLEHLEHLALSRLSAIQSIASNSFFQPFVQWMQKQEFRVLSDLGVHLIGSAVEVTGAVIRYSVGFSSGDKEHIEVLLSEVPDPDFQSAVTRLDSDLGSRWILTTDSGPQMHKFRFANAIDSPSLRRHASLIRSPSEQEKATRVVAKILESLLQLVGPE